MEPFLVRYRNLLVLLALLLAQIIGLATQVRRSPGGRVTYDPADRSGVRLIRLWANGLVSPPERMVEWSKMGVGGVWQNYLDLRHVRQQNKDLQETVDRLRLEQAALLEDARQGQRLQALLGFQENYLYKTVAAQVIGASGSEQSRVFYLDKGSDAGLRRDMAVITPEGIVGKIREVYPHSAQVLMINDQTSGAGVILLKTRIRGILRGNAAGQPQVEGILADNRIQPGETVLTAGGDEIFPRGLPVGTVARVARDPERDGFIDVIVKPAANLNKLDEVLVITSMEPRFNPQQMKDLATSRQLKGADAAALIDQQKASQVMAERLPTIYENAPGQQPGAPGQPAGAQSPAGTPGAAPAPPPVPKLIAPLHPDRFTPGNATGTEEPGQQPAEPPASTDTAPRKKPEKPAKAATGQKKPPISPHPPATTPQEKP